MKRPHWKISICRRGPAWVTSVLLGGCLSILGPLRPCEAQNLQAVSGKQKAGADEPSFEADLEQLSRRLGVAFVVEGQPLPPVKQDPPPTLKEHLSQEEAVREVADYFDYAVQRQGNVYLLTKRYTNAEDMPDVTPEECRKALKDLSRIMAPFNPHVPLGTYSGEPMANIAHLLSAEQLEALTGTGVPVSTLTATQRAEVWKLAMKFYIQTQADHIEEVSTQWEERKPADPVFHWQTISNIHAFGYDTRSVRLNKMLFIPVSDANKIVVTPNGMTGHFSGYTTTRYQNDSREISIPTPDPTDPLALSETTRQWLDEKDKTSFTISIAQAIDVLNHVAHKSGLYKVDPIYAAKKVTLIGAEKLSPTVRMQSLAAVYGLRVTQQESGDFLLTAPLRINPKNPTDIGRCLAHVIPAPLYRAIHTQIMVAHKKVRGGATPLTSAEYSAQAYAIYSAAIRMFRYTAEPAVKAHTEQKLALSHLGERANRLFAIVSAVNAFSEACWLADRTPPPYITDFDHLILVGGLTHSGEGVERFSLHLSYIDPKTGVKYRGVGFSNAILP